MLPLEVYLRTMKKISLQQKICLCFSDKNLPDEIYYFSKNRNTFYNDKIQTVVLKLKLNFILTITVFIISVEGS